jgi:hypothetical protein
MSIFQKVQGFLKKFRVQHVALSARRPKHPSLVWCSAIFLLVYEIFSRLVPRDSNLCHHILILGNTKFSSYSIWYSCVYSYSVFGVAVYTAVEVAPATASLLLVSALSASERWTRYPMVVTCGIPYRTGSSGNTALLKILHVSHQVGLSVKLRYCDSRANGSTHRVSGTPTPVSTLTEAASSGSRSSTTVNLSTQT